jgi:hypothetical protein
MIRLHKHAAVLVVKEPEALEELLETEGLGPCLGPRLSDTAAWVDHRRAETLRELLVRAGYTPKATRDAPGV